MMKFPTTKPANVPFTHTKHVPQLIPIALAASAIGRSPRTLRRYILDGALPAVRLKGRLLVHVEELRAFVARHQLPPAG